MLNNYPRVLTLIRGGKPRRAFMVQPDIHRGYSAIMRVGFMTTI